MQGTHGVGVLPLCRGRNIPQPQPTGLWQFSRLKIRVALNPLAVDDVHDTTALSTFKRTGSKQKLLRSQLPPTLFVIAFFSVFFFFCFVLFYFVLYKFFGCFFFFLFCFFCFFVVFSLFLVGFFCFLACVKHSIFWLRKYLTEGIVFILNGLFRQGCFIPIWSSGFCCQFLNQPVKWIPIPGLRNKM